jgi:hypothetical protein
MCDSISIPPISCVFDSNFVSCQGILVLDDQYIEQTLWAINNVSIYSMLKKNLKHVIIHGIFLFHFI